MSFLGLLCPLCTRYWSIAKACIHYIISFLTCLHSILVVSVNFTSFRCVFQWSHSMYIPCLSTCLPASLRIAFRLVAFSFISVMWALLRLWLVGWRVRLGRRMCFIFLIRCCILSRLGRLGLERWCNSLLRRISDENSFRFCGMSTVLCFLKSEIHYWWPRTSPHSLTDECDSRSEAEAPPQDVTWIS